MSQNSSDDTKQRKKAALDCNHTTPSDTKTSESGVVGGKRSETKWQSNKGEEKKPIT